MKPVEQLCKADAILSASRNSVPFIFILHPIISFCRYSPADTRFLPTTLLPAYLLRVVRSLSLTPSRCKLGRISFILQESKSRRSDHIGRPFAGANFLANGSECGT